MCRGLILESSVQVCFCFFGWSGKNYTRSGKSQLGIRVFYYLEYVGTWNKHGVENYYYPALGVTVLFILFLFYLVLSKLFYHLINALCPVRTKSFVVNQTSSAFTCNLEIS